MTNAQLLETENLIRSLADELLKLKSAVQQYEETRTNLSNIHESLEKIGIASQSLAENTKTFMAKLEQIDIEKRLERLREDGSTLKEGQVQHAELLNSLGARIKDGTESISQKLSEGTEKTIQKLNEGTSALKEEQARRAEILSGQHMQQSKTLNMTRILVLAALLAQVATVLILFLR